MKNYLKVLVALVLAIVCIFAYTSCGIFGGQPGGEQPGGDQPGGEQPGGDQPGGEQPGDDEEVYQIKLVYSYVYQDGTRTRKESTTVNTIPVPVDNTGWTSELVSQVKSTTYNGYTFVDWYAEWDVDAEVGVGDAYAFPETPITGNVTLYGYRGSNVAGPNATWAITEEGEGKSKEVILTISGTGDMFDFANGNAVDIPWYEDNQAPADTPSSSSKYKTKFYYNTVTKVVVEEGITSIGSNSFNGFTALDTLELPSTITKIGNDAFSGIAIKTLKTPASLKTLGNNAFANCLNLREVVLNDGLETIGIGAFNTAYKIKTIVVPASLKSIGNAAFHPGRASATSSTLNTHQLSKVYYLGTENQFSQIDIAMDNAWFNELASVYYYYEAEDGEEVRGPYWHYAKTPTGDATTTPVQYCYALKYFLASKAGTKAAIWVDYVPVVAKVDENGEYVLDADGLFVLEGIIDEDNVNFRVNKKYHGYEFVSFGANSDLEVGMVIMDDKEFDCSRYTSSSGSGASFVGGGTISEDGGIVWSFSGGTLTISKDPSVEVKEGREPFRIFDFESYNDAGSLWVNSITALTAVKNIVIEDGVEYIGRYTFSGLVSVVNVWIPASVKQIDITAFDTCAALTSIYYDGNDLSECLVTDSRTEGAAVRTLAEAGVLQNNNAVVYARTDDPVAVAGRYWTDINGGRVAWELSEVLDDNQKFVGYNIAIGGDNALPDFQIAEQAPWYGAKDSIISASFAKNITALGENVLAGYSNLKDLSLPVDLRIIPESALAGIGIINDMSAYTNGILVISNFLIKVSPTLKNESLVEVPDRVLSIAGGAFARCNNTTQIYIPGTVQYINPGAFVECGVKYIFSDGTEASWGSVSADADISDSIAVLFKNPENSTVSWTKQDGNYVIIGCIHSWSDWFVVTEPTHSQFGVEKRVCLYNDEHFEERDISKIVDHEFLVYEISVPANCTDDAIELSHCEIDGCTATDTRVVEGTKLGGEHVFVNYVDDNNFSCYKLATKTAVCENPNNPGCTATHSIEIEGTLIPHNFSVIVTESGATCQNHFNLTARCDRDGCVAEMSLGEVENTDVTSHKWVEVVAPEYISRRASLYAPAIYYKSCEYCGVCCTDSVNANDQDGERYATFVASGTELKYYDWNYDSIKVDAVNGPINAASADNTLNAFGVKGNFASLVYEGVNKVLAYGKNGTSWATVNIANTQKTAETEDTVHVIETMFRIGEYEIPASSDNYFFQFNLATASNNSKEYFLRVMFYDNTSAGNVALKLNNSTTFAYINVDEWYSFRFEYYTANNSTKVLVDENGAPVLDEDGKQIIVPDEDKPTRTLKIYVNGDLMYSTDAYVPNYNADGKIKTDAVLDSLYLEPRGKALSGMFYFDDTYIATVDREFWEMTANYVPEATDPEEPAEPEAPVTPDYDFEKVETEPNKGVLTNPADGIVTVVKDPATSGGNYKFIQSNIVADPKDAANKVLWINTVANTGDNKLSSYTEFAVGEAVGNGYVFTSKLLVAAGNGVVEQICFTDTYGINISFSLNVEVYEANGKQYVRIVEAIAGPNGRVATIASGIALNEWFELSVEFFKTPVVEGKKTVYVGMANIYVNGEFVGYSDAVDSDENGKLVDNPIEKVILYHDRLSTTTIYLDDVTVGSIDKEFVPYIPYVGFSPVFYGQVEDREEGTDSSENTITFEDGIPESMYLHENGKDITDLNGASVFSFYEMSINNKVNKVIKVATANEKVDTYSYITLAPTSSAQYGIYEFSADVYWGGVIATKDAKDTMLSQFVIRGSYGDESPYVQLINLIATYDTADSTYKLSIGLNNTNDGGTGAVTLVSDIEGVFDRWINFKIVMNKFGENTTVAFYIDGERVAEPVIAYHSTVATLADDVTDIMWRFNNAAASTTYIDDIFFDCISVVEKPSIRPEDSVNDSNENAITFEDGIPENVTFNVNDTNITEFTSGNVFSLYETNIYDAVGNAVKNTALKVVTTENDKTSYATISVAPVNALTSGVYTFATDIYYENPVVAAGTKQFIAEMTIETDAGAPSRIQLLRFYLANNEGVLSLVIEQCNDGEGGTGGKAYELTSVPNVVDNWFNLEIIMTKAGLGTNVAINVNGEEVVAPTVSYHNTNAIKDESKVTSLVWRQRKNAEVTAYIDNIVFECAPLAIDSTFDAGVSQDFVDGAYGDFDIQYVQGEGITDGAAKIIFDYTKNNGYLAMIKNAVGEGDVQSYFDIIHNDTDGNIFVYNTPVRLINNNGEIVAVYLMNSAGDIVDIAYLAVDTTDNTVKMGLEYDDLTDTGVLANEWFDLRYVYYPLDNGTSYQVVLTVDGNTITLEKTSESGVALATDITTVRFVGADAWIGELDIDYVQFGAEVYVPTKTETVTNSVKYDFEVDNLASYGGQIYNGSKVTLDTTYENAADGYATIVTDAETGNKYLEFGKNSYTGATSLILNADIGGGVGPYTVSFDFMMISATVGTKNNYATWPLRIRMGESDKNSWTNMFATGKTNSADTTYYFKTNSNNDTNVYFATNTWVTFVYTYDPVSENCQLKIVDAEGTETVLMTNKRPYYNGNPAFEYNDAVLDCILLETRGSNYYTDIRYAIDDLVVTLGQEVTTERGNGKYADLANGYENVSDEFLTESLRSDKEVTLGGGYVNDDGADGANTTANAWATILNTVGMADDDHYLNLGKQNSSSATTSLVYTVTPETTTGDKYVFETDIMINGCVDDFSKALSGKERWHFNIYFQSSTLSGSTSDYIFQTYALITEDGKVALYSGANDRLITVIEFGAWYNLRIEYTPGEITDTTAEGVVTKRTIKGDVAYYVNNTFAGNNPFTREYSNPSADRMPTNADFKQVELQLRGFSEYIEVSLDNTYVNAVSAE